MSATAMKYRQSISQTKLLAALGCAVVAGLSMFPLLMARDKEPGVGVKRSFPVPL